MRLVTMLLAFMVCGIHAWSYRITDNYTIESKFKINALAAGIAFRAYEGFDGQICMWQFNVGTDGSKSNFRPHDWKVGGILLQEKDTRDYGVTLNTTDWFVTKIVISNNGSHADTYLRRADDANDVLIDSRDGNFRFGLVGTRQDHDGQVNESASYDYFKVTANETGDVLYYEDFETSNGNWRNDPIWDDANGWLTTEGRNLNEVKYYPNNMFKDAIEMHYTVEADLTIESGFVSLIFGLTDGGSNYMWQISPNYYGDGSVCTYYHLDNGNESWKAHAGGPRYPDFEDFDILFSPHHVMIEVDANVVKTYIDGMLEDTFTQCDMTDLALLNPGKVGIRVDGGNGIAHRVYVDNVKVTEYDAKDNATISMFETFDGGVSHFFEIAGKNASYASVVFEDDNYALLIDCDGTTDNNAKVRLIQTDVCYHNYVDGICTKCDAFEEPGFADGVYTISNLGQLCRYAQIVNGENQSANGSLLNDIDMKFSNKFTPIGLNNDADQTTPFRGTFYGNNHVIRNLYVKTNCEGGLFSRLRGGKIYNLGLENGHIESTANLRCGAIAGEHHDNAIMQNCYARGTFEFVTTHQQTNALAAETAGGHIINCYTTLPKLSCDYPMDGTSENSYEGVTTATSGELCYKLGDAFRQTLGEDDYPVLDQTHAVVSYVGEAGWATFYDDIAGYELGGDVKAYVAVLNNTWLELTEIPNVPADTPVILKGTYYNKTDKDLPAINVANELQGTGFATEADGTMYVLANVEDKVGFYKATAGTTIPAGKAYYQSTSGVKAFFFAEDNATAIEMVNGQSSMVNGSIFNLAGQRLSKMQKGMNIVNGKKLFR